jgi:hypothetical protein
VVPFAATNPAVDFSKVKDTWTGEVDPRMIGKYIDTYLLTIGGCLTWQVKNIFVSCNWWVMNECYFLVLNQRVTSCLSF